MVRLLIVANEASMFRDFLNPFAAHFRAKGWRVDAMACDVSDSADCTGRYDHYWDVPWSRSPFALSNVTRAPRAVREAALAGNYDLVHVHTPIPAFVSRFALRAARNTGRPKVIYTAHGFHFHDHGRWLTNLLFRKVESIAGAWTDYLVVMNRADQHAAERDEIVPAGRLLYMPGIGIDTNWYRPERVTQAEVDGIRRELRLADRDKLLLMIAEFIPRKRHRDALRAFASLADGATCLAFAGDGPLVEPTRALARACGVEDRVRFLGFRRDVPALIRASSVVLLPSEQEGLPRCIMEALAMETPVVGANIRGTRDLIGTEAGLMVDVGDVDGLCKAISWVLRNRAEAQAMARRGRIRMQEYELGSILRQHEELYSRALGAPINADSSSALTTRTIR